MKLEHRVQGRGPALLLVAGTGFPGATWPPAAVTSLARGMTVVTFDHRGTGGTPPTPGPYATRMFAADAVALLRDLGLVPAHVLGHSMGGRVAQWMALDAPDAVASLVLAASGPGRFRPEQTVPRGVPPRTREQLAELGYEAYMAAHIRETFFTPEFAEAQPEGVAWLVSAFWENRPSLGDYLKHVAARQRHQTAQLLDRIRVPTLVLVGERDTHQGGTGSHWEQSQYLATRIPAAELRVIAGASHGLFWEKPEETIGAIREWLVGAPALAATLPAPSTAASS
ncbi:MAG TPA: alpha/beta hydrolase [Candidatus Limnocylindria bacterium]|nr:alpha/beta hydrolase [Candidatus Limnocylindria bacterium]